MKRMAFTGTLCVALTLAGCGGASTDLPPAPGQRDQGSVPAGAMSVDRTHYESVIEMLRGRVPGLEIIETQPGRIEVRVRGMNQSLQVSSEGMPVGQEPLVVVDGMPSSRPAGEVLMSLNPQDVVSIDVLKDVSSTAVYGTRGANGVIIVRTVRHD